MRVDAEGPVPWEQFGPKPDGGEFTSISGNFGWLIEYMAGATTSVLWKGGDHEELRVQSDGALTIVPPSPGYAFTNGSEVGSVPKWLRDHFLEKAIQQLTRELRPTYRDADPGEIDEALTHIDPDDYDTWIKVGMALKSDGFDLQVWEEWSKRSDKWKDGECDRKWAGFHDGLDGITHRTILYWAEQGGVFKRKTRHELLTDVGNGKTFARMAIHPDDLESGLGKVIRLRVQSRVHNESSTPPARCECAEPATADGDE